MRHSGRRKEQPRLQRRGSQARLTWNFTPSSLVPSAARRRQRQCPRMRVSISMSASSVAACCVLERATVVCSARSEASSVRLCRPRAEIAAARQPTCCRSRRREPPLERPERCPGSFCRVGGRGCVRVVLARGQGGESAVAIRLVACGSARCDAIADLACSATRKCVMLDASPAARFPQQENADD